MISLINTQEHIIKDLFSKCEDTLVWSYLQGYMGEGFTDDLKNPRVGRIISNDFCYLAGDVGVPKAIEIVTKENYRNQGLATICGAKLILECLKRGKYPSWDAANRTSVRVAEKLGYHFDKSYTVYYFKN